MHIVIPSNTKPLTYTPIRPKELTKRYKRKIDSTINFLEKKLPDLKEDSYTEPVLTISGSIKIYDKLTEIVKNARDNIFVALWSHDFKYLEQHLLDAYNRGLDVKIDNQSHNFSLLAIQGPKAADLMRKMGLNTNQDSFTIKAGEVAGIKVLASRTGYTGEDGWEILVENEFSEYLWDKILEAGQEFGIKPIGLGARDTLRLEAALHLYGNDLDEDTTPVEAGLSWSIPKDKEADYNGKAIIMEQLANGGRKKLIALKMLDKSIARHGYDVYFNGEKAGHITSGGPSPTLGENIALAYVKNLKEICTDTVVQVMIREKLHDAVVVKKPFVSKRNKVKGE